MDVAAHVSLLSDRNLDAGRADATALLTDGAPTTFGELHTLICRFASRLKDHGVRRGERVLLVLDDTPRFHAAFLGTIRAGAVPVPLNFLARAEDFAFYMDDAYARLVVADQVFLDKVEAAAHARSIDLLVGGRPEGGAGTVEGWLADGVDHVDPVTTHPDDPAFWLYSSGSTGRPKGVVHVQRNVAETCRRYAEGVLQMTAEDRALSTTKLFHAYGLGNGLSFPMYVGASAVQSTGRPAPDRILEAVEAHRPTVLFSVPALYNAMLSLPSFEETDLSSVRIGASAAEALPGEIVRQWKARAGTDILDGIGSTEMLHIYCSNRIGDVRPGTSGRPVDGYALQLRDEDGRVIEEAEAVGDLYVKGDSALAYYWHNLARTRRCLDGAWFFSGDRYRRDADGYYAYEGRADDMMKVKGLWVSPIDIENRLIEHDAVREAAVVGVRRDGMTAIKAFVILVEDYEGTAPLTQELQTWCKDKLLRYQFPHEVEYVADFPRTATGKVQRFRLRAAEEA